MSHILQLIPVVLSHKFFWIRAMGLALAIAWVTHWVCGAMACAKCVGQF